MSGNLAEVNSATRVKGTIRIQSILSFRQELKKKEKEELFNKEIDESPSICSCHYVYSISCTRLQEIDSYIPIEW